MDRYHPLPRYLLLTLVFVAAVILMILYSVVAYLPRNDHMGRRLPPERRSTNPQITEAVSPISMKITEFVPDASMSSRYRSGWVRYVNRAYHIAISAPAAWTYHSLTWQGYPSIELYSPDESAMPLGEPYKNSGRARIVVSIDNAGAYDTLRDYSMTSLEQMERSGTDGERPFYDPFHDCSDPRPRRVIKRYTANHTMGVRTTFTSKCEWTDRFVFISNVDHNPLLFSIGIVVDPYSGQMTVSHYVRLFDEVLDTLEVTSSESPAL